MREAKSSDHSRADLNQRSLFAAETDLETEKGLGPRSAGPQRELAALLDASEAAAFLHVPRSTLYELVRSRGLPHVRIGRRGMRFTRADLEFWIARNTVRAGR